MDVYVLAEDEAKAAVKAVKAMRDAGYAYTDYVKSVILIASSGKHKATSWLIGS